MVTKRRYPRGEGLARACHERKADSSPFAPLGVAKLFTAGLETYPGLDADARGAIDRTNALALFPRLGTAPPPAAGSALDQARHAVSRVVMRGVARLINP